MISEIRSDDMAMKWNVEFLWVLALVALASSLAIGNIGGGGPKLVLAFTGSAGVIAYVILKGIGSGSPRFLERRRIFTGVLIALCLGVVVASVGGLYIVLGESTAIATYFEIVGTVIFVSAVAGFVLTLAVGARSKAR